MKKTNTILLCSSFLCYTALANSNHNDTSSNSSDKKNKFTLTDEQLRSDVKEKKRLQKSLTPDQFILVLEDLAILRLQNKQYAERIKVYEEWEASEGARDSKIEQDYKNQIADYEEKLKNACGNGDIARGNILDQIKAEGIDPTKLKFRVQVGEVTNYQAATALKEKIRALGLDTWILPVYKGYVIPLKMVENQISR